MPAASMSRLPAVNIAVRINHAVSKPQGKGRMLRLEEERALPAGRCILQELRRDEGRGTVNRSRGSREVEFLPLPRWGRDVSVSRGRHHRALLVSPRPLQLRGMAGKRKEEQEYGKKECPYISPSFQEYRAVFERFHCFFEPFVLGKQDFSTVF